MAVLKVYKYRIYPDTQQKELIEKTFGCARLVYNQYVSWSQEQYKKFKENGTNFGKKPEVSTFKKQFDFLKEVDSLALANAKLNFEKAQKDFFKSIKGLRKGKKLGLPSFKKKGKCRFSYKTNRVRNTIRFLSDSWIQVPKLKKLKIRQHRKCIGVIKSATISRTGNYHYYISILVELTEVEKPLMIRKNRTKVVGLDMSLPKFLVSSEDSDDTIVKYQHNYRKQEKRLKKLQRRVSKKVEDSKNRQKARIRFASLNERIGNSRKDFCIKMALYFARKYDVVVIEDLNMQAMSRTLKLGKSVMDLGWGQFKNWLAWECQKYDTQLVIANKWYASSKTCHHCGAKNKDLKLSDRKWVCPTCGAFIEDRDRNAALNLRDYYFLENKEISTGATPGIKACGEETSTQSHIDFGQASPLKQEKLEQMIIDH